MAVGGIPADGEDTDGDVSEIVLTLSEALHPARALAEASYRLVVAGADGVFSTGDDTVIALAPAYVPLSTEVHLAITGAPLAAGSYRLVVEGADGLADLAGNRLDGDGDGIAGGGLCPHLLCHHAQYAAHRTPWRGLR